jgi:hypothetical protein
LYEQVLDDKAREFRKYLYEVMDETVRRNNPDYYTKRKYGKYTIYNKEGWRVAWGLNEREMKNYMKLLKKEE